MFAMLDLILALAHHLIVFSLFGIVFAEMIAVRQGMSATAAVRIASIDLWYGLLAGLILIVGFSRAHFAAKGWDYYSHNVFFWAKIGTFAVIGALSVPPTLTFLRWWRSAISPTDGEIARVRLFLHTELALFAPLLGFAAAMARGYGELAY
jgi:putative membrane protein